MIDDKTKVEIGFTEKGISISMDSKKNSNSINMNIEEVRRFIEAIEIKIQQREAYLK